MTASSEARLRANAKYKKLHREKVNKAEADRQRRKYVHKNPFKQAWKELLLIEV